jgi:hypothetical protein
MMPDTGALQDQRVIVTEKMDGENITVYRNYFHGRSVDGPAHPSRDWLRLFLTGLSERIPAGMRICGEYLYARHTVHYDKLDSYFLGFSAWNDYGCLPWDNTLSLFKEIGIRPVPLFYDGPFDRESMHSAWQAQCTLQSEGYIVRSASAISTARFRHLCGKFVRGGYVQTDALRLNVREGCPIVRNAMLNTCETP